MELRDYQIRAVDAAEGAIFPWLGMPSNALLVLATGLGKTVIFSEIIERALTQRGVRALVLAHRAELIDQAAERMPVLAGVEMAERSAKLTDRCVVASVQTLNRRLPKWPRDHFGIVVCDEAHHATADSYDSIRDHFAAPWLGVTATPDRFDRIDLAGVFGAPVFEMSLGDGIKAGWLVPIEIRHVTAKGFRIRGVGKGIDGDYATGGLGTRFTESDTAVCVAHEVKATEHNRSLVYVPSVANVEATVGALTDLGIAAKGVTGKTPKEERRAIVDAYKRGAIKTIVNCLVFTEGFDAPETDFVVMARPTRSRALFLQCIGRGTRLAPGKSLLRVSWLAAQDETIPDGSGGGSRKSEEWSPAELAAEEGVSVVLPPPPDAATDARNFGVHRTDKVVSLDGAAVFETLEGAGVRVPTVDTMQFDRGAVSFCRAVGLPDPLALGFDHATEKQQAAIGKMWKGAPNHLTRSFASRFFTVTKARQSAGLCSLAAAWCLWRYKLPPNVSRIVADHTIAAIKGANWKLDEGDRRSMFRRMAT